MRHRLLCGLTILLAATAAHAQAQMPPRDRSATPLVPEVGTAIIRGRVVDGQTGSAVVRARVRLNGGAGPHAPTLTDETGAFAFTALPHGTYSISADKPTYVQSRYPDTGQTFRTMGRPLTLGDGQVIEGLTLTLFGGGAIAGHVVDAHGDPVETATVQALRLPKTGRGRPQMRSATSTNDLGEFRIARLEPGRYLLFVIPRHDSFAEMNGPPGMTEPAESLPAPTFYPGVSSLDQAQPITIERGGSAVGLELPLIEGIAAMVTGTVVDAGGEPASRGASISVRPIVQGLPTSGFGSTGTGVRPDGTFKLRLSPGEYELEAHAWPPGVSGPPRPNSEQFGTARLTVSGDISGLAIQLGFGARISGRVVFDGASPLPTVPPNSWQVQLVSPSQDSPNCRTGRAELAADFTFTVEGVFGTCTVRFNGPFGRWSAKSVIYNGTEMLGQTGTFGAGQRFRDVQVILTDRRSEVALQVADERGQRTREYVGVLFAADKSRWTEGSLYVRSIVPRPDPPPALTSGLGSTTVHAGAVTGGVVEAPPPRPDTVAGLPPGDYFAIAVDDMEPNTLRDPDALERLSRGATRVTLTEGAKIDVTLRRIKLSDLVADR